MPIDITKLTLEEILDLKAQLSRVKLGPLLEPKPTIIKGPSVMELRLEAAKEWDWKKTNVDLAAEHGLTQGTVRKYRIAIGNNEMTKIARIDTSTWDWSKPNSELGREQKMDYGQVAKLRWLHKAPQPAQNGHKLLPPMLPAETIDDRISKYADVDWTKPDIEIARERGVTRERIRQVRVRLGKPKIHFKDAKFLKFKETFKDVEFVDFDESIEKTRVSYATFVKYLRILGKKRKLKRNSATNPKWELMNFELPNSLLQRIWKIPVTGALPNKRCNYIKPKALFASVKGKYPPEFEPMVKAEEAKAAEYFAQLTTNPSKP